MRAPAATDLAGDRRERDTGRHRRVGVTESRAPARATFRVWRGDRDGGRLVDYDTAVVEGMVVLDAIHQIQAEQANDLAVRWNCKAGSADRAPPR